MWNQNECKIAENLGAGIRDKSLGRRVFWRLRKNREIRQIPENQGEVTARREPRPTGRAKLLLSPIQPPVAASLGQPSSAQFYSRNTFNHNLLHKIMSNFSR